MRSKVLFILKSIIYQLSIKKYTIKFILILTIKFDIFNFSRVDNMLKNGLNFKGFKSLNVNCTKSSGFYMLQVIHSSVTPFDKIGYDVLRQ